MSRKGEHLSDVGEFGLVELIRRASAGSSPSVLRGIGDDAAAVIISPAKLLLATTDMLIEDVHFDLTRTDAESLGWKSIAVNVSDIAAMGGIPRFCLTALGIPPKTSVAFISQFYRGCNELLRQHNMVLIGGDTCSSPEGLTISVTVLGEIERKRLVPRSGAAAGHRVFVTGTPGDSSAGLELLLRRGKLTGRTHEAHSMNGEQTTSMATLAVKHLRPNPRTSWGRMLALSGCASAMIDISDGISSDLGHICKSSGVGALIRENSLPLSREMLSIRGLLKRKPVEYSLSGGEDYELLFTVPPRKLRRLHALGIPVTEIGEIVPGKIMRIVDENGKKQSLNATGYDHFAAS